MNDKIVPVGKPNSLESILDEFGREISEYSKGYFDRMITTTKTNDISTSSTLYIIVPEIGYNYRVLNLRVENENKILLTYFTLKSQATESDIIDISLNVESLYNRISELLSTNLANQTFKFLVDQVDIKRENNE